MLFCGRFTRVVSTDVFHYQAFLIFAYLRATEQLRENNRFSVLKSSCGGQSSMAAQGEKIRRFPKAYREADAPIGGELSITAGEPKANLRTEPSL